MMKKSGLIFITVYILSVFALQLWSIGHLQKFHDTLRHLYYLPVILSAYFLGVRGGIVISVTIAVLNFYTLTFHSNLLFAEIIIQSSLYVLNGIIFGFVFEKIQSSTRSLQLSKMSFLRGLSNVLDTRDTYTEGHSVRVANLALLTGKAMGLTNHDLEILYQAGIMHDIGKVGISDLLLRKTTKLNSDEYEIIKTHSEIAYKILKDVELFEDISMAVKHHHEHYDGTGYPDNLMGEHIPLFSRIISVADAYDAITSRRVYDDRKTREFAIHEIQKCSGTQFDPAVVSLFKDCFKKMKTGESESSGEIFDPVCKMKLTPESALYSLESDSKMYYFCSKTCYDHYSEKIRKERI